jgi:hypothetical protein
MTCPLKRIKNLQGSAGAFRSPQKDQIFHLESPRFAVARPDHSKNASKPPMFTLSIPHSIQVDFKSIQEPTPK